MNTKWNLAYGLAVALAIMPTTSFATPEEMEDYFSMTPAELSAIPVTIATGTPKPNFRSAGSISVITAEQIRTMGATELHEILETVPGMHASIQPVTNDYHYSIRGIANESNSQLLMLLNGTRITSPFRGAMESGVDLPVAAIERVEVIRGPGSALYGADAFAGVVNIITKKAKDINGTQLGVRAGNWDTQSGWGQHGTQWAGWDIAASVQYSHSAGDNGRIIQTDNQSLIDTELSPLGITPASQAPGAMNTQFKSLNSHLNLQRKHWDIGFWALNSFDVGTKSGFSGALDRTGSGNGSQYLGDVRFSTEDMFDEWEFLAHLSYLHSDIDALVHFLPANTTVLIGPTGDVDFVRGRQFSRFSDGLIDNIAYTQRIPSIELSSVYKGLDNHLFKLGAGFRYEEITPHHRTNNGVGVTDGSNPPALVGSDLTDVSGTNFAFLKDTNRTIASLFLQDEWQIADDWHLTSGFRYDEYSDFGGTVNPRFALAWDVNEQLTSKLLYGKAFRAPSFTEQGTQNNPILLGNRNLAPETINTVEWAIDYRPFSSLRTGLNLYYYYIEDLIATKPISNMLSQYSNVGDQEAYGTELSWDWQPAEQWRLSGNYAWQNSRSDITKQRVTGVPEHHVYFAAIWQFMAQWQFQSQLNWVGGRVNAPSIFPKESIEDYETIDFTLRGKKLWGHLNLAASLRNAFDADYLEPARSDRPFNLPMPGRSFYLEASVDF